MNNYFNTNFGTFYRLEVINTLLVSDLKHKTLLI